MDSLHASLAAADSDLKHVKTRVAELQAELAAAASRVESAEHAAAAAQAERAELAARLCIAIDDSTNGRAMVQQLSEELARYRDEVERVRSSLVAKQAVLDQQEARREAEHAQLRVRDGAGACWALGVAVRLLMGPGVDPVAACEVAAWWSRSTDCQL